MSHTGDDQPDVITGGEPAAYVPTDRRHALAGGFELPARSTGAVIFVDISGFTPLTEALVTALGPQRGAEELVDLITRIWNALVGEVDLRRGTVINYAGDAMNCWFDDNGDGGWQASPLGVPTATARAVTASFAIQEAMREFSDFAVEGFGRVALGIKVAVATGPAVRFVVGDPTIHLIDAQAGEILQRAARGEHLASQGDVIVDEATVHALDELHHVAEWRVDDETDERFAVLDGVDATVDVDPWPSLPADALGADVLRSWLLPPVASRLYAGQGRFLTELRPAIAMFIRFGGIDYDNDPAAPELLDRFIRSVQTILHRLEGYILQLTIGDKGSYVYAAFGAPIAHGDDPRRATAAALEIRDLRLEGMTPPQIGLARGRTRAGSTGSDTRRNYGVMGDAVNLAARLMMAAGPGDVVVEQAVRTGAGHGFAWEVLPPLQLKGKAHPARAFRLVGLEQNSAGLREPDYAVPMVGRADERVIGANLIDTTIGGAGQILGITGEAGLGKSRLVGTIIRDAREHDVVVFGGECQSFGTNASYLVWQPIIRGLLGIDGDAEIDPVAVADSVAAIDPDLVERVPLLGTLLNIAIADTALTAAFDATLRKSSLEALVVDLVRARAARGPIMLVLEDVHWIDPASQDLLTAVARAITDVAVMIVVAYRPTSVEQGSVAALAGLAHFHQIELSMLSVEEVTGLVHNKLSAFYGDDTRADDELAAELAARSNGNPFYVEELLNFLHERGVDPRQPGALADLTLPDSLHSLILGRIDQLTEDQKSALKVASVIGRIFNMATLAGVYAPFAEGRELEADLQALSDLDLTLPDVPEPEMTYLFKHALTQEVSYETLSFAMRAMFHDQIGQHLEARHAELVDRHLDLLAFHFDRSPNVSKRREYLIRAGVAAQTGGANLSAISYFGRALPLLEGTDRIDVLLRLAQAQEIVGQWDAAEQHNDEALTLATEAADVAHQARAAHTLAVLDRKRGRYPAAQEWLSRALRDYAAADDTAAQARVLADSAEVFRMQGRFDTAGQRCDQALMMIDNVADQRARDLARAQILKVAGTIATWQGDYPMAWSRNDSSLTIRRELEDKPEVAVLLNNQGILARFRGDLEAARQLNTESIALLREIGDRWAIAQLLNNQACVAADQGDHDDALALVAESLVVRRQLGDLPGLALSLNTLADILVDVGDTTAALPALQESLTINRELDDRTAIAYLIEDYAAVAAAQGAPDRALRFAGFAAELRQLIEAPLPPGEAARVERLIAPARAAVGIDHDTVWDQGRGLAQDLELDRLFAS